MGDVHYMISEAAKQVSVETHVLRYWEEELMLDIGRTEMGHRYYTKDDIQLFRCIKELKEQGLLLKDLKNIIPEMLHTKKELQLRKATAKEQTPDDETLVIQAALRKVLLENNEVLSQSVLQGMDFLLQAKERQEEERYKKLDMLIRQQQGHRKEIGKSTHLGRLARMMQF